MEIKEKFLKIMSQFGYMESGVQDLMLFEDLGLDSLNRTELVCRLEEEFGFEFKLEDLEPAKLGTVKKLYNTVREYVGDTIKEVNNEH